MDLINDLQPVRSVRRAGRDRPLFVQERLGEDTAVKIICHGFLVALAQFCDLRRDEPGGDGLDKPVFEGRLDRRPVVHRDLPAAAGLLIPGCGGFGEGVPQSLCFSSVCVSANGGPVLKPGEELLRVH